MSNSRNSKTDSLRGNVIDELITADNWFTLVKADGKVKVFANTNQQQLVESLTTLLLNDEAYVQAVLSAMENYVKARRKHVGGVFIPYTLN